MKAIAVDALLALSHVNELYPRYWETFHGSNAYEDAYLDAAGRPVASYFKGTPNPLPTQVRVQTNNMTSTFIPELDRLIEIYDQATTLAEIKTLAAQIEQIIHDDGMWINGWATPFYRGAYWRYVKWPADFNGAATSNPEELFVLWIDHAARAEHVRGVEGRARAEANGRLQRSGVVVSKVRPRVCIPRIDLHGSHRLKHRLEAHAPRGNHALLAS